MKLLKKITILLCFLSLIAFISCSAEDKSGVKGKDNTGHVGVGTGGNSEMGKADGNGGSGVTGTVEIPKSVMETYETNFSTLDGTYKGTIGEVQVKNPGTPADITGNLFIVDKDGRKFARFGFNVPKWKKRNEDGEDIKLESVYATNSWGWDYNHTNINIVYYYDTSTLKITFKDGKDGNEWSFEGTKQP
ncbi:hypothetical protein EPJ79_08130 [Brachyspira aalborgi]|uniref:Lipoprotein n=1 Tax=Brachyspira aalborgi TaxID=29522 RepID=A0A5C8D6G8_9SPIR|nr:hypothetical protein [Brachyspira aalborgi]TXJ21087.1 hypothetical protein EPJ79_08130 [Brachyspira aalborgi]